MSETPYELHFVRTKATFRGAMIWHVVRFGHVIGRVFRTGKGEKLWCNGDEDRMYYPSRKRAAIGLVDSFRYAESSVPCPYCGRGPKIIR